MKIFTIGHSNHSLNKVVANLAHYGIEMVVDVRTSPYSKNASQFNHTALKRELPKRGFVYSFMGDSLGGIPKSDDLKNSKGEPDYEKMAADKWFVDGIKWLLTLAQTRKICLVCAEEDPAKCHRSIMIAPALSASGAEVIHIREDGSTEPDEDCAKRRFTPQDAQMDLFD